MKRKMSIEEKIILPAVFLAIIISISIGIFHSLSEKPEIEMKIEAKLSKEFSHKLFERNVDSIRSWNLRDFVSGYTTSYTHNGVFEAPIELNICSVQNNGNTLAFELINIEENQFEINILYDQLVEYGNKIVYKSLQNCLTNIISQIDKREFNLAQKID